MGNYFWYSEPAFDIADEEVIIIEKAVEEHKCEELPELVDLYKHKKKKKKKKFLPVDIQ